MAVISLDSGTITQEELLLLMAERKQYRRLRRKLIARSSRLREMLEVGQVVEVGPLGVEVEWSQSVDCLVSRILLDGAPILED